MCRGSIVTVFFFHYLNLEAKCADTMCVDEEWSCITLNCVSLAELESSSVHMCMRVYVCVYAVCAHTHMHTYVHTFMCV